MCGRAGAAKRARFRAVLLSAFGGSNPLVRILFLNWCAFRRAVFYSIQSKPKVCLALTTNVGMVFLKKLTATILKLFFSAEIG